MRLSRRRGVVTLRLEPVEAALLTSLFDDFVATLDTDALPPDDPVRRRLFPAAYRDDDEAEAEFRSLTETSLRTDRSERAGQCATELASSPDVPLDDEAGQRWIKALNDLRLALGTRLGVTEDDDPEIDPDDPDAQTRAVYYWLTAVQDSLVRALMR